LQSYRKGTSLVETRGRAVASDKREGSVFTRGMHVVHSRGTEHRALGLFSHYDEKNERNNRRVGKQQPVWVQEEKDCSELRWVGGGILLKRKNLMSGGGGGA